MMRQFEVWHLKHGRALMVWHPVWGLWLGCRRFVKWL